MQFSQSPTVFFGCDVLAGDLRVGIHRDADDENQRSPGERIQIIHVAGDDFDVILGELSLQFQSRGTVPASLSRRTTIAPDE